MNRSSESVIEGNRDKSEKIWIIFPSGIAKGEDREKEIARLDSCETKTQTKNVYSMRETKV